MKTLFYVMAAFMLVTASNDIFTAPKPTKPTIQSSKDGQMNEKTASLIIAATNSVVELYNNHLNVLRYVTKALDQAEENIEVLKENIGRTAHTSNCVFYHFRDDKIGEYNNNFKKAPNFPEKAAIMANFDYVRANSPRLDVHCKALNEYFSNKNYKTDENFVRYKVLWDSLYAAYVDVSSIWRSAMDLSAEAGDRAEIVILKKSPIAEFIIPLKTDLVGTKKLMKLFGEEVVDYIAAKKFSDSLALAFANNKRTDNKNVKKLTQYTGEENYKAVYTRFEECIKYANQIIETCDPERNPSKNAEKIQEDFKRYYDQLLYAYNSAIDMYNFFEN